VKFSGAAGSGRLLQRSGGSFDSFSGVRQLILIGSTPALSRRHTNAGVALEDLRKILGKGRAGEDQVAADFGEGTQVAERSIDSTAAWRKVEALARFG